MGYHGYMDTWNGLPSPGDLPDPGIELTSPVLAGGFFTTESQERWLKRPICGPRSPEILVQ